MITTVMVIAIGMVTMEDILNFKNNVFLGGMSSGTQCVVSQDFPLDLVRYEPSDGGQSRPQAPVEGRRPPGHDGQVPALHHRRQPAGPRRPPVCPGLPLARCTATSHLQARTPGVAVPRNGQPKWCQMQMPNLNYSRGETRSGSIYGVS